MITTSDEPRRESRVVRIAVLGSIAIHLLAFLIVGLAHKSMNGFFQGKKDKEELVTLSQAITIDHRKKAVPLPAPVPHKAVPPAPRPQPKSDPAVAQFPAPPISLPKYAPQVIEKPAPASKTKPEESTKTGRGPVEKRIAREADTGQAKAAPQTPAERAREHVTPPRQAALNNQQIAELESQFRKTIAEARSQIDPMANTARTPVTIRHAAIQVSGPHDDLRAGEGTLAPVTQGYKMGGLNCYNDTKYRFVWEDNSLESGSVPWPACFTPKDDPFIWAMMHPGRTISFELPAPPKGFVLPPHYELQPFLKRFYPERNPNT